MRHALAVIAAALLLTGCGAAPSSGFAQRPIPSSPSQQPGSPWVLKPGTFYESRIRRGTGKYNPANGYIDFDPDLWPEQELDRTTNLAYTMPDGTPAIARMSTAGGVSCLSVPPDLNGALVEQSDGACIGEVANYGASRQWPPEPLVTLNPIPGEVIFTSSFITYANGGTDASYRTRYQTISHTPAETITTLVEGYDTAAPKAYVQKYVDGEMVEQWAGLADANNDIAEVIFARIVSKGINP